VLVVVEVLAELTNVFQVPAEGSGHSVQEWVVALKVRVLRLGVNGSAVFLSGFEPKTAAVTGGDADAAPDVCAQPESDAAGSNQDSFSRTAAPTVLAHCIRIHHVADRHVGPTGHDQERH